MKNKQNIMYECPKCSYRVTEAQYMNIVFEPECWCYKDTGIKWGSYKRVKMKKRQIKIGYWLYHTYPEFTIAVKVSKDGLVTYDWEIRWRNY